MLQYLVMHRNSWNCDSREQGWQFKRL